MIDAETIARIFEEERNSLAVRVNYAGETLSDTEKLIRAAASYPVPPREVVTRVVEEVFYSSLLAEEGRPCRPRALYGGPDTGPWPVHRLACPVAVSRELLRKLGPAQGRQGYLRWFCDSKETPVITGIQMRQGGDPMDLIVAAPKSGALDLNWMGFRLVKVRAGRLDRLSAYALPAVGDALNSVRSLLGSFEPVFLGRAIRAIIESGHGGSLWLVPEGRSLDGIAVGRSVIPDEKELTARPDRFDWLASIGHLAAVDGAVVLDARLRVRGFAAFVELGSEDVRVRELLPDGKVREISWVDTGGGRHRSAIAFCRRFAPAAAVVVSEDGRTALISARPEELPMFVELGSLGLSDLL